MDNPFKENVLAIANRIRKTNRLPESDDVNDAAVLLLTHIVVFAQGKAHYFPVKGHIKDSEAVIGAVFLCFVGSQIVLYIEHEGIQLPINEVIAMAGKAVFQFLGFDKAAEIIHSGMEQYKAIIRVGDTRENVREYTQTISDAVWAYVVSKDEGLLEAFRGLYMTLNNSQDR
jgi:hypothetical protein